MTENILQVFMQVLNLSLVGSYIILLVLLARLLLRKSPRWCSYLLWGIVFIRLIIPVFPESGFSLIPARLQDASATMEIIAADNADEILHLDDSTGNNHNFDWHNTNGHDQSEEMIVDGMHAEDMNHANINTANKGTEDTMLPDTIFQAETLEDSETAGIMVSASVFARILKGASLIWAIGVICFGVYHIRSYYVLKKQVSHAKLTEGGVYEIQGDHLSFVLGIFKPVIYLSGELDEAGRKIVLCHEQIHLKRKDYLIKPIALSITCIHWFNPLVWLAFCLMSKDCEISCDEKVIAILGEESKKVYSYALLDEATRGQRQQYKRRNTCSILSFGEDGIKNRIQHVLHFKKTPAWLLACTAIFLVVLVWGLCSNSGKKEIDVNGSIGTQENVDGVGANDIPEPGAAEENNVTDDTNKDGMEGNQEFAEGDEKRESVTEDPYNLARFQNTQEAVLERWATAFADQDGNVLYHLSHDKEAFEAWEKIKSDKEGYKVDMASSWAAQFTYELQYEAGAEEAVIRYWIVNHVPEIYPAYETVRLVQEDGLYYVDHVSYKEYNHIENLEQFETAYGKDYRAAKDTGTPYDLATYEKTGYTKGFVRTIMQHVFQETNPEYYDVYKDPVTAAKSLLHLGKGSGEVSEYLHSSLPGRVWASGYGEGTVLLISYTFAEDSSTIQIPMVLVDESLGIWGLSTGDLTGSEEMDGVLPKDTYMARNYPEIVRDNRGNQYEISELGICALNVYNETIEDRRCIYPKFVLEEVPMWLWEDKLYFPTCSEYSDSINSYSGSVDWVYDSICEIDMLTNEYKYLPLPQEKIGENQWIQLNVHSGFIFINGGEGVALADAEAVWEGKTVFELTDAQKDAYGSHVRDYLLKHPGEILPLGNRSLELTTAIVDMNGDGSAEEISIIPNRDTQTHRYYAYDYYDLRMSEYEQKGIYADRLSNEIWAFSPDGEEIYVALYEDGPSGDPRTMILSYEEGKLVEAGNVNKEIEKIQISGAW